MIMTNELTILVLHIAIFIRFCFSETLISIIGDIDLD